ncbi:MAG: oligosaccharide flippase family protein [Candidatus Pacebacteria bacterium]|mgnify:CR=1 FL=1|nr:oligosaccharide flippase family protein [Candidatus Paceibacterota bacterium]
MKPLIKLFQSTAGRQSLMTTVANFLAAGLMAVAMIILGRRMGPVDFGTFSVGVSLMLIFHQVINVGFSQLIPRFVGNWYQEPQKQKAFLAHVLFWQGLLALILLIVVGLFLPNLAKILNYPHSTMILLSALGAVFFAFYSYLFNLFIAKQEFAKAGLINILQATFKLLAFLAIIFAWQSNLLAISSSYYLALLLAGLVLWAVSKEQLFFKPKALTGKLAKQVNRFWLHSAIAAISLVLIDNLDLVLVQQSLGEHAAGLYSGAMKVAMFLSIIGASLESVLNSRVARYKDKAVLKQFLKKSQILIILSLVLLLAVLPLSKYLIIFTLGADYLAADSILRLLLVNVFLLIPVLPLTAVFYAIDRPGYFSTTGLMRIVIIFALSIWLLPKFGAEAVAASRIVATLAVLFYSLVVVRKEMK